MYELLMLIKKHAHEGTKFRVWLHAKLKLTNVLFLLVEAKLTNLISTKFSGYYTIITYLIITEK